MQIWVIEYDSGVDSHTGAVIGAGQSCHRTVFAADKVDAERKCDPFGEQVVAGPYDANDPELDIWL